VWGLREVLDYHEVLLNRDDIDAKADAFLDFLADRVVEKEFRDEWGSTHRVRSFAELERLFRLANPPHRDDSQGPQSAPQHLHALQRVGDRRRQRE
jgi:hypothetical protein